MSLIGRFPVRPAMSPAHWRRLADQYLHGLGLSTAHEDILNVLQRVVVDGKGWGLKDPMRGRRFAVRLDPSRIAKKGLKCGQSTLERALRYLVRIGIVAYVGLDGKGRKLYTAAWDPRFTDAPNAVFETAAYSVAMGMGTAGYWRENGERLTYDPVRVPNQCIAGKIAGYGGDPYADGED